MKCDLPDSANDLLIKDGKLLMRTLSIYEVLRRFSHIIQLSPFRFEDFIAVLLAEDQSPLLAEIHIQLLRVLMREDRIQQTWLGPTDIRDAVTIYLHLADHSCWPAALRIYTSADLYTNADVVDILNQDETKDYPFNVDTETKLEVLDFLCNQFLLSNLARDVIVSGVSLIEKRDTNCRCCSKSNGDLIPCDTCPAVYHSRCIDSTDDDNEAHKNGHRSCLLCRSNHIQGVSDCVDPYEYNINLKRHDALGTDKSGRRYWFLVRRLFIVDEYEKDVRYYTNFKQLDLVVEFMKLQAVKQDKSLIAAIEEQIDEFKRQMAITQDLHEKLLCEHKNDEGTYNLKLGQEGSHKNYVNHYTVNNSSGSKNNVDRDMIRSLNHKFSVNSMSSFKWIGSVNGNPVTLNTTIKATLLKFESNLPQVFVHPEWPRERGKWIKEISDAKEPEDYAIALSKLETCIKPVLLRSSWFDALGFSHLFRSTLFEREELRKTDRQPRGFERREWFSQDFEQSQRMGTMVKFSAKLKPVKHQVWKQKGEEYRLTGLNGWTWQSCTLRFGQTPPVKRDQRSKDDNGAEAGKADGISESNTNTSTTTSTPTTTSTTTTTESASAINTAATISVRGSKIDNLNYRNKIPSAEQQTIKKRNLTRAKLPPCHKFETKKGKIRSMLVLPDIELRKLARSGGMKEIRSFSYTAKQAHYVWPYGMTPRPTFRTCWLYRNRLINTIQDVGLQLKVLYSSIRWDDLQTRPPASGHRVISSDEATISIHLLKKRDKLPYLTHSEYLIKKVVTPIEQPSKYRKIGTKTSTPSARSGLRARRQIEEEEEKGPTTEEVWVPEEQLELWELKQFNERIERQNQLMRERALREEAEKRRKAEEEKRRKAEQERKRRAQEAQEAAAAAKAATAPSGTPKAAGPGGKSRCTQAANSKVSTNAALLASSSSTPSTPGGGPNSTGGPKTPQACPKQIISTTVANQPRSQATTPVLRYFRTEQGQIIRLPASYLQRGTPLILRHVGPGSNQMNTYIIRPQITPVTTNIIIRPTIVRPAGGPTLVSTSQTLTQPSTSTGQSPSEGLTQATGAPTPTAPAETPATTLTPASSVTTLTLTAAIASPTLPPPLPTTTLTTATETTSADGACSVGSAPTEPGRPAPVNSDQLSAQAPPVAVPELKTPPAAVASVPGGSELSSRTSEVFATEAAVLAGAAEAVEAAVAAVAAATTSTSTTATTATTAATTTSTTAITTTATTPTTTTSVQLGGGHGDPAPAGNCSQPTEDKTKQVAPSSQPAPLGQQLQQTPEPQPPAPAPTAAASGAEHSVGTGPNEMAHGQHAPAT